MPVVRDVLREVDVEHAFTPPVPEGVAKVVGLRVSFAGTSERQRDVGVLGLVGGVDGIVVPAPGLRQLFLGGRVDLGPVEDAAVVAHLQHRRSLRLGEIS